MNILFVTDYYLPHIGGVEKLFGLLTEKLVDKGDQITYITWKYDKRLLRTENIKGVKVIRVSSPSRLLFSLIALPRILKEARKADLIHTSTYSSAFGAWIAGRIVRKKVILTVHEIWGKLWMKLPFLTWPKKKCFQLLEKLLFTLRFEKYVAVSDFTAKSLNEFGISKEKITRIYNGIDYNLPQWIKPEQPFTFTYFGRSGASKGLDLLLEAAEKFTINQRETCFKFILSPQPKKIFRIITKRIKKGPLKNTAEVLSQLPHAELINELVKSNCIVIPSYCEGFGFTAAEASAMNIPIISSGRGSLPEVASGSVITMNELTSASLLQAMEEAIKNQFDKVVLRKFTIETFLTSHVALYKEVDTKGVSI